MSNLQFMSQELRNMNQKRQNNDSRDIKQQEITCEGEKFVKTFPHKWIA